MTTAAGPPRAPRPPGARAALGRTRPRRVAVPAQGIPFDATRLIPVPNLQDGLVAGGDVTGDGLDDLVVADPTAKTFRVLQQNADGSFSAGTPVSIPDTPTAITTGVTPVDNDIDVFISSDDQQGNGFVDIYENQGGGTFNPSINQTPSANGVELQAGTQTVGVVLTDLNADARNDVIALNQGSGNIFTWIASTPGTPDYGSPQSSLVGANPVAITFMRFDNDAVGDVAILNGDPAGPGSVTVLVGTGTGVFSAPQTFSLNNPAGAFNPQSIAAGSFTGGATDDIAIADQGTQSAPGGLFLLPGTGSGFGPIRSITTPIQIFTGVSLGTDFDGGGGIDDVAVVDQSRGLVFVLLNPGSSSPGIGGPFDVGDLFSQTSRPTSATAFTDAQSGLNDLAISDFGGVGLVTGRGGGNFVGSAPIVGVGGAYHSLATADFNADGSADLAAFGYSGTGGDVFVSCATEGSCITLDNRISFIHISLNGNIWADGAAASVLNGGSSRGPAAGGSNVSIVVADKLGNVVVVYPGNGDGSFQGPVQYSTGPGPTGVNVADFNGDGSPDLAVPFEGSFGSPPVQGGVSILIGNGDGTFQPHQDVHVGEIENGTVGDFNGDGKLDVLLADCLGRKVWFLPGTGTGTLGSAVGSDAGICPYGLSAGDLNGDGKPDAVVTQYADSHELVLLDVGNGTFGAPVAYDTGLSGYHDRTVLADLDGDGKLDLVASADPGVAVFKGNGDGTFQAPETYAAGTSPFGLAVADLDGDGKPDIVADGTLAIMLQPDTTPPDPPTLSEPSAPFQKAKTFNVAWSSPSPDVATYDVRSRSAQWNTPLGNFSLFQDATSKTHATFTPLVGDTVCFSARATDTSGNVSAYGDEVCTEVPLDDRSLKESKGWTRMKGKGFFLGTATTTTARGATLTKIGVRARQLAILVETCPGCGSIKVLLDGKVLKSFSLASASPKKEQLLVLPAFASVKTGSVVIKVTSSGKDVVIDGLGVSAA